MAPNPTRQLSDLEIRLLINAGIPSDDVQAYARGDADANTQARANVILANGGSFKAPGSWAGSRTQVGGNAGNVLGSLFGSVTNPIGGVLDAIGGLTGARKSVGGNVNGGTGYAGRGSASGGSGTFPRSTGPVDPFGGDTIPKGTGPASKSNVGLGPKPNSTGGVFKKGGGAGNQTSQVPLPTLGGLPPYPTLGDYTVYTVTPHDFMDKATELTDQAFQPLFDSLNASKTNIGEQGARTQQIVGGLYDNLRNDIAEQAAKTANEYKGNQEQTQQAGDTLGKQIGSNYQAANADTASTLANLGLGAAAPEATQQNTADQAWQQGQAATNTQAQNAYYGQQAQGSADYNAQLGNIASNQGAVEQGNIVNQVSQMLAGVDQNIASNQADKGQLALTIANQLTQQDLQAQTTNVGSQQHAEDANRQAQLDAYAAAAQSALTNNQINQQQYENIVKSIQQEYDNMRQAQLDAADQADKARQAEIDRERILASTLPGDSSGGGAGGSADGTTKPTGTFGGRQQAEQAYPGLGADVYDYALQLAGQYDPNAPTGFKDFMEKIRFDSVNGTKGWDQNKAAQVALQAWIDMYKNSATQGAPVAGG